MSAELINSSRLKVSQLTPPAPVVPTHVAASLQVTSRHVRSHLTGTLLLPLKEQLFCNLCCQKMANDTAFQLSTCGHTFCEECIRVLREHNTNAPGDSIAAKLVGVAAGNITTNDNLISSTINTYNNGNEKLEINNNCDQVSDVEEEGQEPLVIECPICLRESATVVTTSPAVNTPEYLCDECKTNEKQVHCSQCRLELCAACDAKIHNFKAFSNHVRTMVGCGGNIDSASPIETTLVCQSPLHVAVTEVLSMSTTQDSNAIKETAIANKNKGPIATHLCLDTGELICAVCAGLPAYASQTCAPISDAAVLRATQIREVAGRVRGWAARAREHIQNVRIASAADLRLRDEAIAALLTTRDSIVSLIDEKFTSLERQLREMNNIRRANVENEIENVCLTVQGALESVTSAEKHAAQRQAAIFVSEFESLLQSVNVTGKKLERVVCSLPEPVSRRYPLLSDISPVMESIRTIEFDKTEMTVENFGKGIGSTTMNNSIVQSQSAITGGVTSVNQSQLNNSINASVSGNQSMSMSSLVPSVVQNSALASSVAAATLLENGKHLLSCKACSTPIVAGCADLRQASLKQKGALYGLPGKVIVAQHVTLDRKKGTPGARHVLCTRCGADIGRWAERETVENKFVPGLIYISSNSVKSN